MIDFHWLCAVSSQLLAQQTVAIIRKHKAFLFLAHRQAHTSNLTHVFLQIQGLPAFTVTSPRPGYCRCWNLYKSQTTTLKLCLSRLVEFKPPGLDLNSKTCLFMCYVCVCPCKCVLVFLENIPDMRSVTDGVNIGSAPISQDGEG